MKSGNLNFLESSGPLQACNGTALPLPLYAEIINMTEEKQRRTDTGSLTSDYLVHFFQKQRAFPKYLFD